MAQHLAIKEGGGGENHGCVKLGTASSYDIKTLYPSLYSKLTSANFIVQLAAAGSNTGSTSGRADTAENRTRCNTAISAITKSYNASTGYFSRSGGVVSGNSKLVNAGGGETSSRARGSSSFTPSYETWMYW